MLHLFGMDACSGVSLQTSEKIALLYDGLGSISVAPSCYWTVVESQALQVQQLEEQNQHAERQRQQLRTQAAVSAVVVRTVSPVAKDLPHRPVKFLSAGQHHFGVQAPVAYCPVGTAAAVPKQQEQRYKPPCERTTSHSALAPTNVGYQLLQKAGWQEGAGLGAAQQGRTAPVEPAPQQGSKGIGFAGPCRRKKRTRQDEGSTRPGLDAQVVAVREQAVAEVAAAAAAKGAAAPLRTVSGPTSQRGRVAARVAAELASEDLNVKLQRHRQVARQELEDARERAIRHYISTAFNDPFDRLKSDESNPLCRPSRLTATNPLLD